MVSTSKKIGYNVYHAPEGNDESYLGFVASLRAARHLAATGNELPRSLYDTANAAGHVNGLAAPDKSCEADEAEAWFGRGGWYCAVAVFDRPTSEARREEQEADERRMRERAEYDVE